VAEKKKSREERYREADVLNLIAARACLDRWNRCEGLQRDLAVRTIRRIGNMADRLRLDQLEGMSGNAK